MLPLFENHAEKIDKKSVRAPRCPRKNTEIREPQYSRGSQKRRRTLLIIGHMDWRRTLIKVPSLHEHKFKDGRTACRSCSKAHIQIIRP